MTIRKQREAIREIRKNESSTKGGNKGSRSATSNNQRKRTVRGGATAASKSVHSDSNGINEDAHITINTDADDHHAAVMYEARKTREERAKQIVNEIAMASGPPSPQMQRTLSSIVNSVAGSEEGVEGDMRVRSVPMSPLKSPAPAKSERTALDVLAEEDDFDMEDIAKYTQSLTSEIFKGAVEEQKKKDAEIKDDL
jgi:hypothetical protein